MFTFVLYEWKQWSRSPMTWIFLLITTLLIFGATTSDSIMIGGGVGSVHKNAPMVVQQYYMVMSLICLLMTTGFMSATANRDFSTGMYQFIFTSPISKRDYFFGKFFGAATMAMIPLLGVSLGSLLGPLMPWVDAERYGPVIWSGHLYGFLGFAVPNVLISGVLVYGLAILFRNNLVSFVGTMGILVLYVVSGGYARDIEQEWISNILDPFGARPFGTLAKYMTVDEQNFSAIPLAGEFLTNRLLWLGIAALALFLISLRFSFSLRSKQAVRDSAGRDGVVRDNKVRDNKVRDVPARHVPDLIVPDRAVPASMLHLLLFETKAIIRNQTFLIILVIGLINLVAALSTFTSSYGSMRYPVTYSVIDTIRGSFYLFVIGIITFYSGVVVWRERDARIAEIEDATSSSIGWRLVAKMFALMIALCLVMSSTILIGIIVQALNGYTNFEIGQYVTSLLVLDMSGFVSLVVVAFLAHYAVNNRYLAYFVFVAFVIANQFIWGPLDIESNMVAFGKTPYLMYSDMNGFGPFVEGQVWFTIYWTIAAVLVTFVAYGLAIHGLETSPAKRLQTLKDRLRSQRTPLLATVLLFFLCGGFVFYNTQILNTYTTSDVAEEERRDYELTYKKYQHLPQPHWVALDYHLDLYPEERALYALVRAKAVNTTSSPITQIHFTLPGSMDSVIISMKGARMTLNDKRLSYRIYTLDSPLQPNDTIGITVRVQKVSKGFENDVQFTSLTENGTFLNNTDIMPSFGYNSGYEIANKNDRREHGLPLRERMPRLNEQNMTARSRNYLDMDADLVNVRTVITTSGDQIAVAPGSLRREWRNGERRSFEYVLDHPSQNFYSFISARYQVRREKWNGIDLEVYHIPEHAYNVETMLTTMKRSLSYYTSRFGPYYHRQCRIIEFPRYSSFAQAFPGTMPYSEGIGFITDLRDVKGDDIDFVFFVVAHEMAHQYWAHQLIGADMQGSEMMSESFAEYSALMVMEQEYGRDKMKKFLSYEMDNYLSGRSSEVEAERPLMQTEGQSYIHYNKGSVVLYYLKEMIGEDSVNAALSALLRDHGYRGAPYPTSIQAVRAFRARTPDSLQYVIDDLFENITIFNNRVVDVTAKKVGYEYEVTLHTSTEKFHADSLGKERAAPLRDFIDIAVFAEDVSYADLGKPLLKQRMKITKRNNTFTLRVKERPHQVGIDPYNLLVDRMPEDNVKKVKE